AASGAPTVALLGDLAFLHDLGALVLARSTGLPLTVVVVNNDGGGIFSFLPVAGTGVHFERLFGTPHGVDLAPAAGLAGGRVSRVEAPAELATALGREPGERLHLIEARVLDRAANVELHQTLGAAVARAVEEEGG